MIIMILTASLRGICRPLHERLTDIVACLVDSLTKNNNQSTNFKKQKEKEKRRNQMRNSKAHK